MINLIGCNKENFFKLLKAMDYKPKKIKGDKEDYFVYKPKSFKNKTQDMKISKSNKNNLFQKLSELRFS